MKTADLLIVKRVRDLQDRLAQQGREPCWDDRAATLAWGSTHAHVARLYLRVDLVDELSHLSIVSAHRCPEQGRERVALGLMALSRRGPLSGWLLHESTGAIELRVVLFGVPGSRADLDALLGRAQLCEAYVAHHADTLQRLLTGEPAPSAPPSSLSSLFSAFTK